MSIHTLIRILEISNELSLNFRNYWVLGNRFSKDNEDIIIEKLNLINKTEIKLLGFIPEDKEIMEYNLLSKSLLTISNNNPAYRTIKELFKQIN